MTLRWALAAAIALVCACRKADDAAQTIVWIDAEPTAQRMIARLRVQAAGPMNHLEPTVETKEPVWPIKLVLAPKNDDASRRFTLHVEGRNDEDDRLMTIQFASGFVAEESRYARLVIHDECVQAIASCKAGEACNVWAVEADADSLGRTADSPRKVEAPCGMNDMLPPRAGAGGSNTTTMPVTAAGAGASSGTGGSGGSNSGSGQNDCSPGFVRMLGDCVDMDECQASNPCGDHGQCQNRPGDYTCECEPGYQSLSGTCMPAGDCQTNNGGCETTCEAAPSGVRCACAADQWLKADRKTCGAFGPATQIDMGGSFQPTRPRFVFDPSGNGLAAWVQMDGTMGSLWTRRYAAGSGWAGPAMRLPLTGEGEGTPSEPRIALDAKGRGVMVWMQVESGDSDVWAAEYDGQKFGPPTRIDESSVGSAEEVIVDLDANGDGYAAWSGSNGDQSRIWVNRFKAGASNSGPGNGGPGMGGPGMGGPGMNMGGMGMSTRWSGPETLTTADEDAAFTPQLSVDSQGRALLVWTQSFVGDSGPLFSPWASRFDLTMDRWRSPVELDDSGAAGYPDGQAFGSDGHAVAVWRRMTDGRVTIRASSFRDMSWSDSVNLGMGDSSFTTAQPRVAVSPAGSGAAVWTEYESPQAQVWSNRYDGAADQWLGPVQLSSFDAVTAPAPLIAVDANGDGFAVWAEAHSGSREIKAWRLQASEGFVGGATLATDMTADSPLSSPVQIAIDPKGNAVVIWDVWQNGMYTVWASTFE